MPEKFLMILEEGPYPDEYEAPSGLSWPLPDKVVAKGRTKGVYKKVYESKGPPSVEGDTIKLRGARYVWDDETILFELGD